MKPELETETNRKRTKQGITKTKEMLPIFFKKNSNGIESELGFELKF